MNENKNIENMVKKLFYAIPITLVSLTGCSDNQNVPLKTGTEKIAQQVPGIKEEMGYKVLNDILKTDVSKLIYSLEKKEYYSSKDMENLMKEPMGGIFYNFGAFKGFCVKSEGNSFGIFYIHPEYGIVSISMVKSPIETDVVLNFQKDGKDSAIEYKVEDSGKVSKTTKISGIKTQSTTATEEISPYLDAFAKLVENYTTDTSTKADVSYNNKTLTFDIRDEQGIEYAVLNGEYTHFFQTLQYPILSLTEEADVKKIPQTKKVIISQKIDKFVKGKDLSPTKCTGNIKYIVEKDPEHEGAYTIKEISGKLQFQEDLGASASLRIYGKGKPNETKINIKPKKLP